MSVVAAGVTVVGVAAVPAGAAAPAITIYGPAHAGYGRTITVTGRTSPVNSSVEVYLRSAGQPRATGHHVSSDAAGRYSITYVATANEAYYAVANGVRSRTVHTPLVTATCTTSGPAFPTLPIDTSFSPGPQFAFAGFTATNNGVWAGPIIGNGTRVRLGVVSWRSGTTPKLIASFVYSGDFVEGVGGSIQVVAVSRGGAVIAAIQRTDSNIGDAQFVGRVYAAGHTYPLSASPNWSDVQPVGVTASGVIVGEVRGATGWAVVSWANSRAAYHVVTKTGVHEPRPVVDQQGDIAYRGSGFDLHVRTASGRTLTLAPTPSDADDQYLSVTAATVNTFFGTAEDGTTLSWTVPSAGTADVLVANIAPPRHGSVYATGTRGGLVVDRPSTSYLTASGARVGMPAQLSGEYAERGGGNAVSNSGTVSYTSASDGLPHFLRCT